MRLFHNPAAGSSDNTVRTAALGFPEIEYVEVDGPEALSDHIREAAAEGDDAVMVAGGDGTANLAANALMEIEDAAVRPVMALLPAGTANDLARTIGLPTDDMGPAALMELLLRGEHRAMDLIRVETKGTERYAVNVCAGGFSGQVDEVLTDDLKSTWGPLAYFVGAVKTLPNLSAYETRIAWEGEEEHSVKAFNVVVANGRFAGGRTPVAPRASPEDGLLDVVVIRECAPSDVARLSASALGGVDYLEDDMIDFRRVERLAVASEPGMSFNLDGELYTKEPVTFTVVPGAVRMVVGPEYTPHPAAA